MLSSWLHPCILFTTFFIFDIISCDIMFAGSARNVVRAAGASGYERGKYVTDGSE